MWNLFHERAEDSEHGRINKDICKEAKAEESLKEAQGCVQPVSAQSSAGQDQNMERRFDLCLCC